MSQQYDIAGELDGGLGSGMAEVGFGWNPLNKVANKVGRFGGRLATLPVRLAAGVATNVVKGSGRGAIDSFKRKGGGGGGEAAPEEEPAPEEGDYTEGFGMKMFQPASTRGMYYMSGQLTTPTQRGMSRRARAQQIVRGVIAKRRAARAATAAMMGISLPRPSKKQIGRLLVSNMPGGATALQAAALARRGLKSGDLKPNQLQAAGKLTSAGRAGDSASLARMAAIRKRAGRGDPAAEKALDTLKLAQCIQTGRNCGPGRLGLGGAMQRLRALGEQNIDWQRQTYARR